MDDDERRDVRKEFGEAVNMSAGDGYVHCHLTQRPEGDVTDTRRRYSLMN